MPVEKLFWNDPYLTECGARVTAASGAVVTLDRTVAYAFSGGQASDAGTIGGRPILSADKVGLDIEYTLPEDHGLRVGDPVTVAIDWPRRYRLMRLHCAAELVLELVHQHFPAAEKIGADITPEKARIDFRWAGSIAEAFPLLAREVQQLVDADRPSPASSTTRLRSAAIGRSPASRASCAAARIHGARARSGASRSSA